MTSTQNIFQVTKGDNLRNIMNDWCNHLVVVMFSTSWCKPCKVLKPYFKKGSLEYRDVFFAYVDCDTFDDGEFSFKKDVKAYPTTCFYLNHHKLKSLEGCNIDQFNENLKELQESIKYRRAKFELDKKRKEEERLAKEQELAKLEKEKENKVQYINTSNGPVKVTPELLAGLAALNAEKTPVLKEVGEVSVPDSNDSTSSGENPKKEEKVDQENTKMEEMIKRKAVEELAKLRQQENILKLKKMQQLKYLQQLKYKKNMEENHSSSDTKSN
jgi:thioredoxin 1